MKKQKEDFVLILWSSVDTPLNFRLSFHVFFYLLDLLIVLSYLPFLSGINLGLECVCMVFLFSALSCIPVLIPSHSSDPRPKGRFVFHVFSKSITMETHGSLLILLK